jgi:hypothetical protein
MVNVLSDYDARMLELHAVNLNSNRNDYKTTTIKKKLTVTQCMTSETN